MDNLESSWKKQGMSQDVTAKMSSLKEKKIP